MKGQHFISNSASNIPIQLIYVSTTAELYYPAAMIAGGDEFLKSGTDENRLDVT